MNIVGTYTKFTNKAVSAFYAKIRRFRVFRRLPRFAMFTPLSAKNLFIRQVRPIIRNNTPAMPLNDAQIGGFFYARSRRV